MMTQTHILVGTALFGRPGDLPRNLVAIAGGIVPDAAIFVLYGIEKFKGTPESTIWRDVYYSPFWQDVVAWGNSIPLALCLLAVGIAWSHYWSKVVGVLLVLFAGSCLAHLALDFPVHVEDAHRHFFPLSNYRFRSPVSYYNPNHFGVPMMIAEACMGIGLSVFLFRRYASWMGRACIGLMLMGYLAVPVYFLMQLAKA